MKDTKKTLSKLRLTQLGKAELEDRMQHMLRGGIGTCGCVCVGCPCMESYTDPDDDEIEYYVGGDSETERGADDSDSNGQSKRG